MRCWGGLYTLPTGVHVCLTPQEGFSHNKIFNAGVAGACAGAVAGLPKGSIQATLGSSLVCGVGLMLVEV